MRSLALPAIVTFALARNAPALARESLAVTPSSFPLPEGDDCSADIDRAILGNDLAIGLVALSVCD